MTRRYINKQYEIDHIQDNPVSFDGFFTPQLSDGINDLSIVLTRVQFLEMLSAIEQGAEVIYPEKYHEITDRFLRMAQSNADDDYVGDGTYYPAHSAMVEWLPVSPFRKDLDQTPDPLILPAWNVYEFELPDIIENILSFFDTSLEAITGYRVGDAYSLVFNAAMSEITDVVSDFLFNGDGENLIDVGFNLHVRGSGTLAVELLSVPLGGRVMYQIDSEPNPTDFLQGFFDENDDILDTERDLISVPPEQDAESIEEITIEGDGDHIIYFRLLPTLNDTLIPLSWGAGLRSIRLGAGLTALNAETGEPLTENESNQNLGLIMTTYDDLRRAIRDGNIDWMADAVAGRGDGLSSNLANSIEIGKDGEVSIKENISNVAIPVNATSEEIVFGGMSRIETEYGKFIKDILDYHSGGVPQASAEARLGAKYLVTANLANAIGDIYTNLNSADPKLATMPSNMNRYLYCNGKGVNNIAGFIIDDVANNIVDIHLIANGILSQDQIDLWYKDGLTQPNTGYLLTPCHRIDPIIVDYDESEYVYFNTVDVTFPRFWRLEISGHAVNSNGTIFDGHYMNGSQLNMFFTRSNGGAFTVDGQQDSEGGGYTFTLTHDGTGVGTLDRLSFSGALVNFVNGTPFQENTLQFKLIDLGGA